MGRRVMIAGTGSGCGKTTVTCALLSALKLMGQDVCAFKCGPDYIDPMFHKKASGVEARSLDVILMGEEGVRRSLRRNAEGYDTALLEGVMGLYDGAGSGSFGSASYISRITETPVILVINAKGAALSACAMLKGYLDFEENNIRGVILNSVSPKIFPFYKQMIEDRLDLSVLGCLPDMPEARFESRHLGLVTADEIGGIQEKIRLLGEQALKTVDWEGLLALAGEAGPSAGGDAFWSAGQTSLKQKPVTIYASKDEAFCFCYEDNYTLLRALGADIRFFSPLHDRQAPEDADGLLLWGGYPELYAQALERNESMKAGLRRLIDGGLPVYAECGGFMYLLEQLTDLSGRSYAMLGALRGGSAMTKELHHFGYYELEAREDNLLCKAGERINAHFFHHAVSDGEGGCFTAVKINGEDTFPCVVSAGAVFAGYQHLHFWGNTRFAENFIDACNRYGKGARHGVHCQSL